MTHRHRRQTIGGLILLSALLSFSALPAAAQLNARPAGVLLVATLESVSLGAVPSPLPMRASASSSLAVTQGLSITATWAVPAHLTTLRLLTCAASVTCDSTGLPVWSAAIISNRPGSHIEQIAFAAKCQHNSSAEADATRKSVRLMIEAL